MRSTSGFLRTSLGIVSEMVASFSHHQVSVVKAEFVVDFVYLLARLSGLISRARLCSSCPGRGTVPTYTVSMR
jgi:hypothetical protein